MFDNLEEIITYLRIKYNDIDVGIMGDLNATTGIVWCGMSFWPFLLPKLILLFLWLHYGSNKPKILGFNFSRPSTSFYGTFKMAAIEITYLAITLPLAKLESRF